VPSPPVTPCTPNKVSSPKPPFSQNATPELLELKTHGKINACALYKAIRHVAVVDPFGAKHSEMAYKWQEVRDLMEKDGAADDKVTASNVRKKALEALEYHRVSGLVCTNRIEDN
jgi:hypothetical protein